MRHTVTFRVGNIAYGSYWYSHSVILFQLLLKISVKPRLCTKLAIEVRKFVRIQEIFGGNRGDSVANLKQCIVSTSKIRNVRPASSLKNIFKIQCLIYGTWHLSLLCLQMAFGYCWMRSPEVAHCIHRKGYFLNEALMLICKLVTNISESRYAHGIVHLIHSLDGAWWNDILPHDNITTCKRFTTLLALCEGNAPATSGFLSQSVSNAELLYFCLCYPEEAVTLAAIWDALTLMWRRRNDNITWWSHILIFQEPALYVIGQTPLRGCAHQNSCHTWRHLDIRTRQDKYPMNIILIK